MRRSRQVLAGVVASSCVLTLAPAGRSARAADPARATAPVVPVTACPPATSGDAPPRSTTPVPSTIWLPGFIDRSGIQVYGVGEPADFGAKVDYALAPPGYVCPATSIGADGGEYFQLLERGNRDHSVVTTLSPGGAGPNEDLACPYIPAIRALVAADRGAGYDPRSCTPPPGVAVRQIPTGNTGVLAAAIRVPPTVRGPDVAGSFAAVPPSDGTDTPVALFTARILDGGGIAAQEIACSVEPSRRDTCTASLDFFLTTQSFAGRSLALSGVMGAMAALDAFLRGEPENPGPAEPAEPAEPEPAECHAALDVKLEKEIDEIAGKKVPIPDLSIELPAGLEGSVSASGSLGHVAVCRSALSTRLKSYSGGNLTFDARVEGGGAEWGPFVYSLDRAAWTATPGAPPRQRLASQFRPEVEVEVNPHLVVSPRLNEGSKVGVELASVELHAVQLKVTLVQHENAVLQATVGPTISLSVEIGPEDLERAVEEAADEGLDRETAIDDAAEEMSTESVVAVEEEASAYYGVDVSSTMDVLYADADSQLVAALDSDPLLAAVPAEPVDPVTDPDSVVGEAASAGDEVSAAEALTDDAAIEVLPLDDILLLLVL